MKSTNKITIIIPTLNEEKGIGQTIRSIPFDVLTENYQIELLVVDGNSKDKTIELARQLGARVIIENNKGYGRAYKTGFSNATGDIIITMDADATYPANRIPEYLDFMNENNLEFMTINRFSSMEKDSMSFSHKCGNRVLSLILRLVYSIEIKDSQSGMWIMRKNLVDKISIPSDGMAFSQDIKIIAFKYFKSLEVGGSYFKRLGNAKMSIMDDGISNLKDLFTFKKHLQYCIKEPSLVPLAATINN